MELRRQGQSPAPPRGSLLCCCCGCCNSLSDLQVAPAEGFSDLAVQVMTSPSKNYILLVIALSVCVLFLVGLLCGRLTKRVTRELKDR